MKTSIPLSGAILQTNKWSIQMIKFVTISGSSLVKVMINLKTHLVWDDFWNIQPVSTNGKYYSCTQQEAGLIGVFMHPQFGGAGKAEAGFFTALGLLNAAWSTCSASRGCTLGDTGPGPTPPQEPSSVKVRPGVSEERRQGETSFCS